MKYQKLVRDKIPEIIKEKWGGKPVVHVADDKEYRRKLNEKLQEEVNEFLEDEDKEELADILEVLYAICEVKKIKRGELERMREKKASERGRFKKKIILDETE